MGIAQAQHEWVVLTDADCRPASPRWLRHVAGKTGPATEVILGYGPLEKRPGFLNAFARFETAMTAIQYFSYALAGIPYMGVGRNLAYRKAALTGAGPNRPTTTWFPAMTTSGSMPWPMPGIRSSGTTRRALPGRPRRKAGVPFSDKNRGTLPRAGGTNQSTNCC